MLLWPQAVSNRMSRQKVRFVQTSPPSAVKDHAAADNPVSDPAAPDHPAGFADFAAERPASHHARPALAVAVALAIGVLAAQFFHPNPGHLLAVATAALAATLILALLVKLVRPAPAHRAATYAASIICDLSILLGLAFAGAAGGRIDLDFYPATQIANFAGLEPRLAELDLTISLPPTLAAREDQPPGRAPAPRQSAIGQVRRVHCADGWQAATGRIRITVIRPDPRLAAGERVRAFGWLFVPGPAANPGQIDWSQIDRRQRILASLDVQGPEQIRVLDDRGVGPLTWLRQRTRLLLAQGFAAVNKPQLAVLQTLLLGDSELQARDLRDDLARNGVTHLISTSGLHVLVLALLLRWLLRVMLVRPSVALWATVIFAVLYAAVVTPSPGAQRSAVAAGVVALAALAGRRVDAFQVLSLAVIVLVIVQPNQIVTPSLQLGVVIVAGLIAYAQYRRPLDEGEELERRAKQIAEQLGGVRLQPRWRHRTRWIAAAPLRALFNAARLCIVAWLISLPLVAAHFGTFNPWSVFISLLLLPLAVLALIAGALKVFLTALLPSLAPAWAAGAIRAADSLRQAAHWTAGVPGAQLQVFTPSTAIVVLALILILLPPISTHLPGRLRRAWEKLGPHFRRRVVWLGPIAAVGLIVAPAIGAAVGRSASQTPMLRLTLLSVGDGQCAVLEIPGSQPLVVDAGGGRDVARDIIEPYLHYRGISGIAGLILTHATAERLSGAADLIDQENPQTVLVGPDFEHASQYDPAAQDVADHLQQAGMEAQVCAIGSTRDFGPVTATVLWPPEGSIPRAVVVRRLASGRTTVHLAPAQKGDESMVLRIAYGGRSILFCSDICDAAMQELLRHRDALACDVMIAPSEGGWCKWTHDFVTGIQPGLTLASSSHILGRGQQQFDGLMSDRPFLRTGVHGAITVMITPDGKISENSWRP